MQETLNEYMELNDSKILITNLNNDTAVYLSVFRF